jgi:putative component of toxin-antitoxin plasmid stabilization module
MTTKDGTRKYVRRNSKGQFTSYQVNVDGKKGAAAIDRRMKAKNYAKPGFRDQGDAKPSAGQARMQRNAEFNAPRTIMTTKDGTRKYIRRNKKGQFTGYQVNIAGKKGAAAIDRRMTARNYAKPGYRDQGDAKPEPFFNRLQRNIFGGETAMEPVMPNSYGDNSAGDSGNGVPVWYGSAEARTRMTTKDGTRKYVRRDSKGRFTDYQVNVDGKKGAAAIDRRMKAKNYAKPGFRDQGDAKPSAGQARRQRN